MKHIIVFAKNYREYQYIQRILLRKYNNIELCYINCYNGNLFGIRIKNYLLYNINESHLNNKLKNDIFLYFKWLGPTPRQYFFDEINNKLSFERAICKLEKL